MENKDTLPLIKNKKEILRNIDTLDSYLSKSNSGECTYAKGLIRRGRCFVIVPSKDKEGYRFYPSRFIGYIGNSMKAHERMGEIKRCTGKATRDGRKTNPAISLCLGDLIKSNDKAWNTLEEEYKTFCSNLGTTPSNNRRKYWPPISR